MKKYILFSLCWLPCFLSISFTQNPDLGTIKKKGNSLKYIAIGSSLSSGVRDGGIYQASQMASFPNLLAQQFGITDFKQSTFDDKNINGTGYSKGSVDKNGILTFVKSSTNNLDDSKEVTKLPKVTTNVDNWSVPYLKAANLSVPENEPGAFLTFFEKKQYRHLDRFLRTDEEKNVSYKSLIETKVKAVDFFTYEVGMHDFVSYYTNGGFGQQISFVTRDREGYFVENEIIADLVAKGGKGAIANVPNVLKFPYFHFYTYKSITDKVGKGIFIQRYEKHDIRIADPRDIFLPTEGLNLLLSGSDRGLVAENPLLDEEVLGHEETVIVDFYNYSLGVLAKKNNLPLVDLNTLYEKILAGNFVTEEGIKIDPSYPKGNFFSSDGIHPTAIGQGIIANEFIKTINTFYGANIPLIKISTIK
jgi:hypothetical protein